jgi:BirA family biotin operon repressor/biotin-[acetyl-CoA-carboxylase] ligase
MQTTSHSLWDRDPTAWPWAPNSDLGRPWSGLEVTRETGSTNADLVAAVHAGAESGKVVVADHQTVGRGRLDRTWAAPPGTSIAISVLLRPPADVPANRWTWLPLVAGLAVTDALVAVAGVAAELKWPNDVLIGGGKVCGILAERVADPSGDAVVIGMGINTRLAADELPVPTATSLRLAGAEVPDADLVAGVLRELGAWYLRWVDGEDLGPALASRCVTIGREVRVELPAAAPVTGLAVGIDSDGRLLVRTAEGVRPFSAGDVVHLR